MEEKEAIKWLKLLKNRYAGKEYDKSLRMAIKALKKQIPMDAKKFLIEFNRMCHNYEDCEGCPLQLKDCQIDLTKVWSDDDDYFEKNNSEYFCKIIEIVEKWSKENPKKE